MISHLGLFDYQKVNFVTNVISDALILISGRLTLLERETGREGPIVFVRPELVVEIAFNDVQESPQYPGGLALRFARVKGYRPDKSASEGDTLGTVQQIYQSMTGRVPPATRF